MNLKYFSLQRWTFEHMKGAERFVYAYISTFSGNGKKCTASQAYIAKRLRISERTVVYAIKSLMDAGWIKVSNAKKRKYKEHNACEVDVKKASDAMKAWQDANQKRAHSMPDVLRVYDWMLGKFGATAECLLYANLYQLDRFQDSASDATKDFRGVTIYGQSALAIMCGCDVRKIQRILHGYTWELESGETRTAAGWIERGIVEIYELGKETDVKKWSKSRRAYSLQWIPAEDECAELAPIDCGKPENDEKTGCETGGIRQNCTYKPDEHDKIALISGDEHDKFAFSESTPYEYTTPSESSPLRGQPKPADFEKKSDFSESTTEKSTLCEITQSPDAEMKAESAEESAKPQKPEVDNTAIADIWGAELGITKEDAPSILTEQTMKARTRERAAEVEQAKKELKW